MIDRLWRWMFPPRTPTPYDDLPPLTLDEVRRLEAQGHVVTHEDDGRRIIVTCEGTRYLFVGDSERAFIRLAEALRALGRALLELYTRPFVKALAWWHARRERRG